MAMSYRQWYETLRLVARFQYRRSSFETKETGGRAERDQDIVSLRFVETNKYEQRLRLSLADETV
jgi:hypothetical protein